jgi:DNA-binding transcriptional MerR regulator
MEAEIRTAEGYTVGDVARIAGVTVRTLHHYDEIGLLSPSHRLPNGYRRYATSDLERLQRIRTYRALGMDLPAIAAILDDPAVDEIDHLRRQRDLLRDGVARLRGMLDTIEKMMEARKMGINLDPEEMFEVFGDFDPAEHAAEAEARWGETDAYKESHRRTSQYTKDDWKRINGEAAAISERFAAAMRGGAPPESEDVMDIAEQHRQHIHRYFYACPHEFHRNLGEMYVADPRFTENIDKTAEGLSVYMRDAIVANAERSTS